MPTILGVLLALSLSSQQTLPAGQKGPTEPKGQVQERVAVERVILKGRVLDRFAKPVPGLGVSDFRLLVDGLETPIESVDWNPGRPTPRHAAEAATADAAAPAAGGSLPEATGEGAPEPQLFVMLFQWEIAGQKDVGFMRMVRQALEFADSRAPQDRIAVLGFGASLRVLQDFTRDRAAVRRAILEVRSANLSGPGDAGPSLAKDAALCGRSDSIEDAFVCIGSSLRPIPGPKTLLFFGWTLESHPFSMRIHYPSIIEAIAAAHTTVFALDVSDGSHRLAAGLKQLAVDTGGTYQETFDFPSFARERVETALEGSYELVFRNPATERGWHGVEVTLADDSGRRGHAVFPRWFRN